MLKHLVCVIVCSEILTEIGLRGTADGQPFSVAEIQRVLSDSHAVMVDHILPIPRDLPDKHTHSPLPSNAAQEQKEVKLHQRHSSLCSKCRYPDIVVSQSSRKWRLTLSGIFSSVKQQTNHKEEGQNTDLCFKGDETHPLCDELPFERNNENDFSWNIFIYTK